MVKDDKYSEKEFESEEEMHLYWAENHMEDLNSHDKEEAKKALRRKEEKETAKMEWRKKMMIRGVGGAVAVVLAYFAAPAIVGLFSGGASIDYDDLDLENQPVLGDEDAEISVVEFGDYRCPACKEFEDDVKPSIMEYIESGDVNLYHLDYPRTVPPSGDSENASIAAQCVFEQDQDEFWNFHDALYVNQGQMNYDDDSLVRLAEQETDGLDYDQLAECVENDETRDRVEHDLEVAGDNRVSATPTIFVNGDRVSNWGALDEVIEDRLN